MVWAGGGLVLAALATIALRSRDPEAVARLVGQLRAIGPLVLAPAPLALVVFGAWLVADSSAWDAGQRWVQIALGLFAAAFLVGVGHQSFAGIAAARAADAGDVDGAARHLRRWALGSWLILALLVAATWDMVFKPGL